MSQKALAKRLGVDPSTLARWDKIKLRPSSALNARLIEMLDGQEPHDP